MSEFKISLRAARINAELTQEQAAKLMGRNKQTIVNWESGKTEISFGDVKQTIVNWESGKTEISFGDVLRLCQVYDVPVEYIRPPVFSDENSSSRKPPSKKSEA